MEGHVVGVGDFGRAWTRVDNAGEPEAIRPGDCLYMSDADQAGADQS
jgi:hypothetical protein